MPEVARSSEFGQLHPGTSESGNTTGNYLPRRNHHPTVKPTALMRYLCRLITPPGGTVLDPFMGSGSAGKAAMLEGFEFIGIEREAEYVAIAEARIGEAQRSLGLFA
jgi:site-specific DNA-methyltransferase (adenine-specific)